MIIHKLRAQSVLQNQTGEDEPSFLPDAAIKDAESLL